MVTGAIALVVALAGLTASLTNADRIGVAGRDVRLGDLASLNGPLSSEVADIAVARLPERASSVPRKMLAELIRRAIPGISISGKLEGNVVLVSNLPPAAGAAIACFEAARDLAEGKVLTADTVRPSPCDTTRRAASVAIGSGGSVPIAVRAIKAGDYLGRIRPAETPAVERGDTLRLISRVGPVAISRPVIALQAASLSHRLFVRTEDGEIFSAALQAGASQ